jgi:hypothetical protein
MRFLTVLAGVLATTFMAASAAANPPPRSLDPDARLDATIQAAQQRGQAQQPPLLDNFKLVGHSDLGGDIDFGDVWAHGDYAYLGSRCGDQALGGGGVRVVDISHPTHPTVVSTLANDEFTRAEDVVVRHVSTQSFTGDLAVVGIQACFGSGHEGEVPSGLRFFDVTDAAHPELLSEWDLPEGSIGCHEVDLVQRPDGMVLAGCARNLFDQIDFNTGEQIPGAVKFVDASDPTSPQLAASWEMPVVPFGGLGCLPVEFAHSVRFTDRGNTAYVSYWDAGTVHLDLANASSPQIVSDTLIAPPDEDGDNHSMTLANGGRWLVVNPEDFSPEDCGPGFDGWGEAYVYDNADTDHPTFLGTFSTPNSRSTRTDGEFTVHNTEVVLGRQFFSSWYSDGIVWWTMSSNGSSHQLGQFVPPSSDRFGVPLVWGVYLDSGHELILASDMGSGLWIVRPKGLNHF